VEEGARPRPHALVYGPAVIPTIERVLVVPCLLVVSTRRTSSARVAYPRHPCV